MNAQPPPAPVTAVSSRAKRRFKWRYVFLGIFGAGFLFVVALVVSLLPGGEVRAMREAVASTDAAIERTKAKFGLGWFALSIARTAISFTKLDADVKTALEAVRSADVSVAELERRLETWERQAVMEATDRTMERKGWERVVGVIQGDEAVGLYMPKNTDPKAKDMRVALFVVDDQDLVTVAGRVRLEPLLEIIGRHHGELGPGLGN